MAAEKKQDVIFFPSCAEELEKTRTMVAAADVDSPPDVTIIILKGYFEEARVSFQEVGWEGQ